jgi:hypothetical protein
MNPVMTMCVFPLCSNTQSIQGIGIEVCSPMNCMVDDSLRCVLCPCSFIVRKEQRYCGALAEALQQGEDEKRRKAVDRGRVH